MPTRTAPKSRRVFALWCALAIGLGLCEIAPHCATAGEPANPFSTRPRRYPYGYYGRADRYPYAYPYNTFSYRPGELLRRAKRGSISYGAVRLHEGFQAPAPDRRIPLPERDQILDELIRDAYSLP